nr:MAG TPA: (p)ppGpp synthetase, RelA/SpoT family [Caudoviricetes sp.]
MNSLLRAYLIAARGHRKQRDKAGKRYIHHPVTVAKRVKGKEAKIVALLHDTLEDTPITAEYLSKYFTPEVVAAVVTLTHTSGVGYDDYIFNICTNALARQVKIQDLVHNMELSRLPVITLDDLHRLIKYTRALERLIAYEFRAKD